MRPVRAIAAVIGVLLVTSVLPVTAGAATGTAASHHPRPSVSHVHLSTSKVRYPGGHVHFRMRTRHDQRCTLNVHPAITHQPTAKHCTGHSVRWIVHLPHNPTLTPAKYRLTAVAHGSHGHSVTRHRHVTVAASTQAPEVRGLITAPTSLLYNGGTSRLSASLLASRNCHITVVPAIPEVPAGSSCPATSKQWTLSLPRNTTGATVTYTVTVTATGTHHRSASRSTRIVETGYPPECPGQTSTATPQTTALFNDPSTGLTADQIPIVAAEVNLICDTQPPVNGQPSHIDLGMYIYDLPSVTSALLWASNYVHADIHVALDGSNLDEVAADGSTVPDTAYRDLVAGLPAHSVVLCGPNAGAPPSDGDDDGSSVFPAGTGCAGDNILHTKLLTVSSVDPAGDPAVLTSSQNLSDHAMQDALNNGLQIIGNRDLYTLDAGYIQDLMADQRVPQIGEKLDSQQVSSGIGVDSFFGPSNVTAAFPADDKYHSAADTPTDYVASLLSSVDCANPGSFAGDQGSGQTRSLIRIAMYDFGNRQRIVKALVAAAQAGCDIQVVYANMTDKDLTALQSTDIQLTQLDTNSYPYSATQGTGRVFVHSKYVLVSGGLEQDGTTLPDQTVVLTGSPNFAQVSLHRNDEAALEYQQSMTAPAGSTPIFDQYLANWQHLVAVAARIPATPN